MRPFGWLILAGLMTLAGQAGAQSLAKPVQISVRWSGEQPRSMMVTTDASNVALQPDPVQGVYTGVVRLNETFSNADLIVTYADNSEFELPLKLSAGTPAVALAVKRPTDVKCRTEILSRLALPAAGVVQAVQNYLTAKAINHISTNDRCGPGLAPRAQKVWFDTSFALVKLNSFFRLDPAAQTKYAAINSEEAAWADVQANGVAFAAAYRQSVKLYNSGEFSDAVALNDELSAIVKRPDWSRAAIAQSVAGDRLAKDRELFVGAVRSSSVDR